MAPLDNLPGISVVIACLFLAGFLYFRQHAFIYHPRPYDDTYAWALPTTGRPIDYRLPFGLQTAYYLPGAQARPRRLWVAFCGNGSLALDWTTILRAYPRGDDAFLLVDYPGYGKNAGYATVASTRATADAALYTLADQLGVKESELSLAVIGHSLGAAVAVDFAARHSVQRIVLIAPFTSLREEAATVVGSTLSHLLIENYDNPENLRRAVARSPGVEVAIFHGTADQVIPYRFGRELADAFPRISFYRIADADHVSVLEIARDQMIQWMNH